MSSVRDIPLSAQADTKRKISTVAEAEARLAEMTALGVEYLLRNIGPHGEPAFADVLSCYHRLPWTLAYVGERGAAASVLSWIERNALTSDGDLREGVARDYWVDKAATYALSIIAQGAWLLERYDTSLAVMGRLRSLQAPNGGAYWERPEARAKDWQVLFPTAQLGMTAITTGQLDMADAVYRWFAELWAAQPDLPKALYTATNELGLVTDQSYLTVIDFAKPRQAFYGPGIAAAFLSRYAMVRGDAGAARIAADLLALHLGATDDQFSYWESTGICKFGFGSAMMLEIAPSEQLLRNVIRMTQWYSDSQQTDGTWVQRSALRPVPEPAHVLEKTAEHVLWVAMMRQSLAGHDRPVSTALSYQL